MKNLLLFTVFLYANSLFGQGALTDFKTGESEEIESEAHDVRIFPNPVVHTFIIEAELNLIAENKVRFELYDMTGKKVLQVEQLTQPVEIVERGHLPKGFYSYILKTSEKVIKTGKLIFSEF
ncbi:MAG: T9SS type A sorting domain-containing protein [Bacteroidota bacterium]